MYQYEQKSRPTGRSRRLEMQAGQRQEPVIQRHKFDAVYDLVWGRRAHSSDIPKIIHRFWAGGAMSRQSFDNIMGMQERIKARNRADMLKPRSEKWVQILWTVRDINQLRADGLVPLAGVQVQNSQAYEGQKRDGRFGPMPPELARSGITGYFGQRYAGRDIKDYELKKVYIVGILCKNIVQIAEIQ